MPDLSCPNCGHVAHVVPVKEYDGPLLFPLTVERTGTLCLNGVPFAIVDLYEGKANLIVLDPQNCDDEIERYSLDHCVPHYKSDFEARFPCPQPSIPTPSDPPSLPANALPPTSDAAVRTAS